MLKKDTEQRAEKATLKRKLTGPPRLLLGRTRIRRGAEDGPDTQTNNDKPSTKRDAANVDLEISSEVNRESSRGRSKAAGEEEDQMKTRNRKVNRRRWWRRFSAAVVCIRKQKKDVEKQKSDGSVPPEGALQETDAAALNDTDTRENTEKVTQGKTRLNVRTWPMFRRILTSSDVHQTHKLKRVGDGSSASLRKEPQNSSTREENSRPTGVPLKNMEDTMKCGSGVTEVVAAEVSDQPTEERDKTAEEQLVPDVPEEDLTNEDDTKVVEVPAEEFVPSDELDADDPPSASEVHYEEMKDETSSSTNMPSIRIELVPPDRVTQEGEEEEGWEEGSSSGSRNHRLLLGFQHSERQLVQTARSLVRAAMNAALDQLSREQSESDCVHRGPPGCRDHA